MVPNPDAVDALARLYSSARLAWMGQEREFAGQLNAGVFALLDLYAKHEAKFKVYEPWGDRGPVYGKPWDKDKFVPLLLATFTVEEVQSLSFMPVVRRWMTPIHRRMYESARERGEAFDRKVSNLTGEAGEKAWHDIQHSTHSGATVAKKHATYEEREPVSFKNAFMPRFPAEDLRRLEST